MYESIPLVTAGTNDAELLAHQRGYPAAAANIHAGAHAPPSVFTAIPPPPGYPALDYRPAILTRTATICLFFLYVGLTAGVSSLAYFPESSIAYAVHGDSYYLAAKYGPALVGAISAFFVNSVTQELLKILPYINMADDKRSGIARRTVLSQYWPQLQKPNTKGTWSIFLLLNISAILIAYKALLLEIVNTGSSWELYVHTRVATTLVAFYGMISAYMLLLTWWLWNRPTGVRRGWSPDCLVDIMALFQIFDVTMDVVADGCLVPEIPKVCLNASYRIGYWRLDIHGETQIVYGIRTRPPIGDQTGRDSHVAHDSAMGNVAKRALKFWPRPYLFYPWFDFTWWFCFLVILACAAGFPILVVTGYVQHGFVMTDLFSVERLDRATWLDVKNLADGKNVTMSNTGKIWTVNGGGGFDEHEMLKLLAANAIFGAIPVLLIGTVPYYMALLDPIHRFMQPLYNMSRRETDAGESILLEYLSRTPFAVVKDAFDKGYWKVCVFSILGSTPEFWVLLPYGIVTITSVPLRQEGGEVFSVVICEFSIAAFTATSVFLLACLFLLICSLPFEKRRIPRPHMTLLDLWAMCHNSRINSTQAMIECSSEHDKDRLYSVVRLWRHKYLLGLCKSSDGKERLGFDICRRGDGKQQTNWVERVPPSTWGFVARKRNKKSYTSGAGNAGSLPLAATGLVEDGEA